MSFKLYQTYLKVVAESDLQRLIGELEVVLVEMDLSHEDVSG